MEAYRLLQVFIVLLLLCNPLVGYSDDYAITCKIARKFIYGGLISHDEAIGFLNKRSSVYKLVYAEGLYNASAFENLQIRDIFIEEITGELLNDYQRALCSG